jgi:hypothetical protein
MKTFLFGAGASYGSDVGGTPPLGPGLFDELTRFNPDGWGTIRGTLAATFRADFEEAMKSVSEHALAPLQRAMAAYFFQFQPRRTNLYFELAQRAARAKWRGAFGTLNYERLLEMSLLAAGLKPTVGDNTAQIEICLPHGCCHVFCEGVRATASGVSFTGFGVQTDGPVKVIGDAGEHRARILQDAFPPVMSYFEPAKRTTSGHSFIEGQRTRWSELAARASTIVIVGVRVRPHDSHLWDDLARTKARIVYCGGPSGASEYSSWASSARKGEKDRILSGYFKSDFGEICREAGL